MKITPVEIVENFLTQVVALSLIALGCCGLGYFGYHSYMEWYYVRNPEAFVSVGFVVATAIVMSYVTFKIMFTRKEKVREWKEHSLG